MSALAGRLERALGRFVSLFRREGGNVAPLMALLIVPIAGALALVIETGDWYLAQRNLQNAADSAAIAAATFLGAMANVFALNPVTALVWAAVINGVVAVPVMALLMLMGANTKIMGEFTTSKLWNFVGWIATLMMAGATGVFVLTTLLH